MRELALFAGGGGGLLGSELIGFNTRCAVEIVPEARDVLLRRQSEGLIPIFPIWDDVSTFDGRPWRDEIDVITGGFPCTDISCAGQGAGITGESSGLFFEMLRIIEEVRPQFVFAENAKELRTKGLGAVIEGLARLGYVGFNGVLGAGDVGANHHRKRMWVVAKLAHAGGDGPRHESRSGRGGGIPRSTSASCWGFSKVAVEPSNTGAQGQKQAFLGITDWWDLPRFTRVDDGGPHRMDLEQAVAKMENEGVEEKPRDRNARVVMTGNMQVPAVAAAAWRILHETLKGRSNEKQNPTRH